jgi:TamB, inner membrane protein subunit of TAM complex
VRARTPIGALTAAGSLGMTETARGVLRFDVSTDSIAPLDDSVRSTLTGKLAATGTVIGGIRGFDLAAEAKLRSLLWGGATAKSSLVRIDGHGLATDSNRFEVTALLDSAVIMGEPIDSARAQLSYQLGRGRVALNAAGGDRIYQFGGSVSRDSSLTTIGVEELRLGEAGSPWTSNRPFSLAFNGSDMRVDTFALVQAGRDGHIMGAGTLAWARSATGSPVAQQPLDFGLTLRGLPFSEFMHIVRSDHALTGSTDGSLRITGTAGEPIVQADATVTNLRYAGATVDVVSASFAYADRRAHGRIDAKYGDRTILLGDGAVPVNLAFVPVKQRKLDEALEFSFRADSMPAALLASTVGGFDQVAGTVSGTLQLHGTTIDPTIAGLLNLRDASGIYAASGVRYRNVNGSFRVLDDSLVAVEASARTSEGRATLNGHLNFAELTNPRFDSLVIDARQFQAANRRDAELTASGSAVLNGSYRRPILSGDLRIDQGSLNLDELYRQYLVVDLDRALLFNVVDTSIVADRRLLPVNYERSPFIKNLQVQNFNVDVQRDAWLRSRNMNVEVSGQLKLIFAPCAPQSTSAGCSNGNVDLRITGELTAIRGTYTMASSLVSRRFDIREGTVEFPGTPGMDPNLSFTALHRARPVQGDVIDIIAIVSGTLQNPRVRLASAEGQPQMSESDLASYLFFGVPTNMLTSAQSSSLGAFGLGGQKGVVANALFNSTYGFLSSGLESFAQTIGFADYVSLTAEGTSATARPGVGFNQFFANTRLEVGRYLARGNQNLFAVVSKPLNTASGWPGARVEWRFGPTYTMEFFAEDRNARAATTFGIENTATFGKVYGFFLFREWGR